LQAKAATNDKLIEKLKQRNAQLEQRLRVLLTEVKRERENPLPKSVVIKEKTKVSDSVLQMAPKNQGRTRAVVSFFLVFSQRCSFIDRSICIFFVC
jgi:hypothetical protein